MATLVIDIGNTLLSWRFRDRSGDLRFGTASHRAISDALDDLPEAQTIAISSVQPAHESELENWLAHSGCSEPIWIRSGADLASNVLTDEPQNTGADRALCALAWGAVSEGHPAVIIDAGSAVTVDAVGDAVKGVLQHVVDGELRGVVAVPDLQRGHAPQVACKCQRDEATM